MKKGEDGDRGDLGDNNFAEVGEKNDGFPECASEGEKREDGENKDEANEYAGEGRAADGSEVIVAADARGVSP